MKPKAYILPLILLLTGLLVSCSTKKNTAGSRFWHSFNARFNTYFNGEQAFIEGDKAKLSSHVDDYTQLLPVFLVGSEKSREAGKGNYETAITKCQKAIQLHSIRRKPKVSPGKRKSPKTKQYLQRQEFNPFLKKAWMLMAKAQFQKGEFLEAAATFSYITRHYKAEPVVVAEARQWMARCYAQLDWFYDAEDALSKALRDTLSHRRRMTKEMDATRADLLLRQGRFADALPFLQSTARHARPKQQKARLYFLIGQVNRQLGNDKEASAALKKCVRLSPPFELSFNARILQTEIAASNPGQAKSMLKKLRRMARNENNKDRLDQVYYAMGNIHLSLGDTAQAISAYEKGREKSTRKGIEKGVLMLRLAELYWEKRDFPNAQACYTEALALIDKSREGYAEASRRSKVLDKLVPFTSAVHLQDSLQALVLMPEAERNAAIDRVIEALKKKEEEERKASKDSAAAARMAENQDGGNGNNANTNTNSNTNANAKDGTWYFYNSLLVMQGKEDFRKRWGNRKNEDNWRRSNRTVVSMEQTEGYDYEADDSLSALQDSIAAKEGVEEETAADSVSAADDPHQREYYLAQLPFTPEAKEESDKIIMDGLYNAGVIEKNDLEDFPLAAETLTRLTRDYPSFEQMPEALYEMFLLYSRWGRTEEARTIRDRLAADFPDHDLTKMVTDPDFEWNARYGREIEDSLYAATYTAYRLRDHAAVESNFARSTEKYPKGLNRPKFIFVHVLDRLATAPVADLTKELRELLETFPESDVSPMAGMILKGLESGRAIGSGHFDLASLWNRRTAAADSLAAATGGPNAFTDEKNAPHLFVLAYPTDSIPANLLLYETARLNFSSSVGRGLDLSFSHSEGLSFFTVSSFRNFNDARNYANRVAADSVLAPLLKKGKVLIVSEANLRLVGTTFSVNDYLEYYDTVLAPPAPVPAANENGSVEEEEPILQRYEDELSPEELERIEKKKEEDNGGTDDEGEWYPG